MALVLVGAALAIGAAACGDSSKSSKIEGRWSGILEQRGLGAFGVTARIRDLKKPARNTVRYTLNCGGTWAYLGRVNGVYRFRETIHQGVSAKCKGSGTVTLTPDGKTPDGRGRLRYLFRGGGVESRGQLVRQG